MQRLYETAAQLEIEIKKVVAKLKEKYPHADFSLGDSGVLALYLVKLLGKGSVSLVVSTDDVDRALHVLFLLGGDYFDETGMQYPEDIVRVYGEPGSVEIRDGYSLDDADTIIEMTEPNLTEDEIEELLS